VKAIKATVKATIKFNSIQIQIMYHPSLYFVAENNVMEAFPFGEFVVASYICFLNIAFIGSILAVGYILAATTLIPFIQSMTQKDLELACLATSILSSSMALIFFKEVANQIERKARKQQQQQQQQQQ